MRFEELEIVEIDKGVSIGEYVYTTIKNNIINWKLKPDTRISEKEISEILKVSRTPVREAFIKLSRENLLEVLPQRGTFISKIDLSQVEEARFIRESLEIAVIKLATENFPKDLIVELEHNLNKQKNCLKEKNYKTFFELDEDFHKLIFMGCKKERTWEVVQMVNTQYRRIRILSLIDDVNFKNLVNQHLEIYRAIKEKSKKKGEEAVSKHLTKLLIDLEGLKNKYTDYFI